MNGSLVLQRGVLLGPRTTLEVGGPARMLACVEDEAQLAEALATARAEHLDTFVLGGGSNVVVADAGFDGLVVQLGWDRVDVEVDTDDVRIRAAGGMAWDALVALAVDAGWSGIECTSGIPGTVGAAPVQNIGAYGQEIGQVLHRVRVVPRGGGPGHWLDAGALGLSYRHSHFRGAWRDRYVITEVELVLHQARPAAPAYGELARRLGTTDGGPTPEAATIRAAVMELRRGKSMVHDPADPNHRSAGSFFKNPIVGEATAARVRAEAATRGLGEVPAWATEEPGRTKLAAAWLIERSGFPKGYGDGPVGLSTAHTLALVNRGGATARDVLGLARTIRDGVREAFGVTLEPEPLFVGFAAPASDLLER